MKALKAWKRAGLAESLPVMTVLIVTACILTAFALGYKSATMQGAMGTQFAILLVLTFPAYLLAILDSKWLMPYILFVWAAGAEVRRLLDWTADAYTSVSLASLAPLIACLMLLIPILKRIELIPPLVLKLTAILGIALVYGAAIGVGNGTAMFYDLANYLLTLLVIPYIASRQESAVNRDMWIKLYCILAVLVAGYGIIQYFLMPPWDAFWMDHVEMGSIGRSEPMEVRVFSSLNSPGPAAAYLAGALAPMILESRWRGVLGWPGVLIVIVAFLLTLVRATWIFLLVMVLVYTLFSAGRNKYKLLATYAALGIVFYAALPLMPGGAEVSSRFQTFGSIEEDNSYNDRVNFAAEVLPSILSNPIGSGLGSSGVGTKLQNDGSLGELGVFDNGFLSLFMTFGMPGALLIFYALWLTAKASLASLKEESEQERSYARLSLGIIIATFIALIFTNGFPGLSGFILWFFVALMLAGPRYRKERSGL